MEGSRNKSVNSGGVGFLLPIKLPPKPMLFIFKLYGFVGCVVAISNILCHQIAQYKFLQQKFGGRRL